jgi:hypothetical protein
MVLVDLLPVIVGAAVLPVWIIMTLFLLRGPGGARAAGAFAAGAMLVRVAQGVLFGYVFAAAEEASDGSAKGLISSTLLVVIAVLMLVTAVKYWRKEEDPDAPPPKWMATLNRVSVTGAFGMGALLMLLAIKQWVFTLSAIAIIEEAALGQAGSVLVYLFFVVAAQSLLLTPIVVYALAPARAGRLLDATQSWLERNNRVIMIVVSTVFGLWFLWQGISGLIG